jgi:hypothetical protein
VDLNTVREVRLARSRADLLVGGDVLPLGGGSWIYSEQQPEGRILLDLTTMGWEPWAVTPDGGLRVAATCTIAELLRIPTAPAWTAQPLFSLCANALLASFKIWNTATVGGNIALALPAGGMIALATALDAVAVVWTADAERRIRVADLVTGVRDTALAPDEVLRSIEFPAEALRERTSFRRISLSPLGRTGTLVIGRRGASGELTFSITGGTWRPEVLRFATAPSTAALTAEIARIDTWYEDPHGSPDWREAMTRRFAEEIREELA